MRNSKAEGGERAPLRLLESLGKALLGTCDLTWPSDFGQVTEMGVYQCLLEAPGGKRGDGQGTNALTEAAARQGLGLGRSMRGSWPGSEGPRCWEGTGTALLAAAARGPGLGHEKEAPL